MNHLLAAEPTQTTSSGWICAWAPKFIGLTHGLHRGRFKAIDLNLVIDLSDEYAATIDFAAGLYYLDTETLNRWGINMFEVSSSASVPVITSDGIRLAYHNDIVDLTQFTNQFPVGDIVEGLGNTIAGVGDITMSDLEWVSVPTARGFSNRRADSNHSHSTGCTEPVAAGQVLHYCLEGPNAMDETYPFIFKPPVSRFPCDSSTSSSLRWTMMTPKSNGLPRKRSEPATLNV